MTYPNSFYAEELSAKLTNQLSDSLTSAPKEFDVIIIGAGLAGITCALELARSGKSVALMEAKRIGWGASGRNGGFVSSGFSQNLASLINTVGEDQAKALFALSREGVEYVRQEATAIDPSIIEGKGGLIAYRHHDPDGAEKAVAQLAQNGIEGRIIPGQELKTILRTNAYFQAVENHQSFHVQPLAYTVGLAQKVRNAGAHIFECCPVDLLEKQGACWKLRTGNQTVCAQNVVLSGSAYMGGLYPRLEKAILPVATYVVTSEPMGKRLDEAINYSGCISDTRRASDYYRRLSEGRLLWGGRITTQKREPKQLAQMLKRDILGIYPELGEFSISHAWSGLMGYAVHKMPIIGELETGLWTATAFGGHGLNTATMGGQLIASAIAEGDDRWRQFSLFGPRWAGGIMGRVATQGAYWLMQGQDWIDEKRASIRGK